MPRELWNGVALCAGVVALAAGGPWLVQELRTLPQPATLAARADQRIVTLEVGGMTCAGCAAKVKGELAEIPGVETAEVRWEQRRAYVVAARDVPDSSLTGAIQRAGPAFLARVTTR